MFSNTFLARIRWWLTLNCSVLFLVQIIVFRSCTPLAQAFLDYAFLHHEFPDVRSLISLGGIGIGAYMYMLTDSEFQLKVYHRWSVAMAYFFLLLRLGCNDNISFPITCLFDLQGYEAYYWVAAYFVLLCFQMTYGKIMSNAMKYSLSSTVLYNNALAIPPMLLLGVCISI